MSLLHQLLLDAPSGYWPLDESSGSTAFDRSGNGRNGIYAGGQTLAGAAFFDGRPCPTFTGLSNGYVDLGDLAAWSSHAGAAGTITIEGWFYSTVTARRSTFFKSNNVGTAYEFACDFEAAGTVRSAIAQPGGADVMNATGGAYSTGRWHHIAMTYNRATPLIITYIDGVEVARSTAASGTSADTASSFFVGARPDSGTLDRWEGRIAHVALFGVELSAARIKAHYEAGIRSGVVGGGQWGGSAWGGESWGAGSGSQAVLAFYANATLVLSATATGSLRLAGAANATLVLSASATAGNYANGSTATGDVTDAATVRFSAYATGSVVTPVAPTPAGLSPTRIKRVSITMPAPTLDATGRPT